MFEKVAANESNPKWENLIKREKELYRRNNEIRSEFERDYTRIIHCNAYRRLKHKTQVFFSPESDHICTRSEHVIHVESISYTIAKALGLNTELTRAIAIAHDLGHSPFGHEGEKVLSEILMQETNEKFWHEKNGLDYADKIELLEDNKKNKQNLSLTYAVRDGIISHCGEIDENCIKPREEFIDLKEYKYPNQYAPYTWEACVVKISDKISYLGRDIEDAISIGILDEYLDELYEILNLNPNEIINNTVIINGLIYDICMNSTPERGLCFSNKTFNLINKIKKFNYEKIYLSDRIKPSTRYFKLVLNEIYFTLKRTYNNGNVKTGIEKLKKIYPNVIRNFEEWLQNYWTEDRYNSYQNVAFININDEKQYSKAIIYYIAGMTDKFTINTYNEIIGF